MVNSPSNAAYGKPRLHNFQGQVITILKRPGRDEPPDCLDHLWFSLSKERTIVAGANIDLQLFKNPSKTRQQVSFYFPQTGMAGLFFPGFYR
ncbi:hypothetical protein [Phaeobacter gallaeciensis]|uniref:hypothetical protein n=1 Tax=Phaeobacter gallaeciensis TaxID=60890 RepID=UPI000BBB7475|nr:hypothetical protein [Phaeobacter gallaeciensis]ATF20610.1 hypothetical protein PhaeoP129_04021 [Phaeobacter gallaeciensis]ATF24719.1 hypothetical protein PhaeoP128_04022 [Phaeobacter gallaeciensis]